ncbi:trypsin alpha-3-like [Photinus pyralis]|uniref:trypsin alpha-3-like n=1 Tax=Photinus pyralis TaxID=7054 RepID=UPI0012677DC0|nr:trypsin alpha-3-like [Photinus pyralis]
MFKLVLVSALFALVAARPNRPGLPHLDGRIVGGFDVTIEQVPYQVSLMVRPDSPYHICGGSIIAHDLILTAAHCTTRYQPSEMRIRYGNTIKNEGGTIMEVLFKKDHHLYNPNTMDYDISVLVLSGRIQFSASAQIIPLVASGSGEGGRAAMVSGWGRLSSGGASPTKLQAVYVREVDRKKCNEDYSGPITERMICFMDTYKDSCQGDSGGPLVSSGVQIGVVSWGWGCADPRYPGVYSNVAVLRDFIGW